MLNSSNPESKNAVFRINKTPLPAISRHSILSMTGFIAHDAYYKLPADRSYMGQIVDDLIEEAREKTAIHRGIDDLSYTGLYHPGSKLYQLYRLTHAAEHLVVAQLYDWAHQPGDCTTYARTIINPILAIEERIGIVFDQRFAELDKIDQGVKHIEEKIAQTLSSG